MPVLLRGTAEAKKKKNNNKVPPFNSKKKKNTITPVAEIDSYNQSCRI